jgi:hypothetical protein
MKPIDQAGPADFGTNSVSNPLLVSDDDEYSSFAALLDKTCERLQDTKNQGSLRRIQKLEEILNSLERELDDILKE